MRSLTLSPNQQATFSRYSYKNNRLANKHNLIFDSTYLSKYHAIIKYVLINLDDEVVDDNDGIGNIDLSSDVGDIKISIAKGLNKESFDNTSVGGGCFSAGFEIDATNAAVGDFHGREGLIGGSSGVFARKSSIDRFLGGSTARSSINGSACINSSGSSSKILGDGSFNLSDTFSDSDAEAFFDDDNHHPGADAIGKVVSGTDSKKQLVKGVFQISDCGSTYGTVLNGNCLVPGHWFILSDGDIVGFVIGKSSESIGKILKTSVANRGKIPLSEIGNPSIFLLFKITISGNNIKFNKTKDSKRCKKVKSNLVKLSSLNKKEANSQSSKLSLVPNRLESIHKSVISSEVDINLDGDKNYYKKDFISISDETLSDDDSDDSVEELIPASKIVDSKKLDLKSSTLYKFKSLEKIAKPNIGEWERAKYKSTYGSHTSFENIERRLGAFIKKIKSEIVTNEGVCSDMSDNESITLGDEDVSPLKSFLGSGDLSNVLDYDDESPPSNEESDFSSEVNDCMMLSVTDPENNDKILKSCNFDRTENDLEFSELDGDSSNEDDFISKINKSAVSKDTSNTDFIKKLSRSVVSDDDFSDEDDDSDSGTLNDEIGVEEADENSKICDDINEIKHDHEENEDDWDEDEFCVSEPFYCATVNESKSYEAGLVPHELNGICNKYSSTFAAPFPNSTLSSASTETVSTVSTKRSYSEMVENDGSVAETNNYKCYIKEFDPTKTNLKQKNRFGSVKTVVKEVGKGLLYSVITVVAIGIYGSTLVPEKDTLVT